MPLIVVLHKKYIRFLSDVKKTKVKLVQENGKFT